MQRRARRSRRPRSRGRTRRRGRDQASVDRQLAVARAEQLRFHSLTCITPDHALVRNHQAIAATSGNEILFVYDLGSPYAWLAAERVDDVLPAPAGWLPVLLGGIFKVKGRMSWAEGLGRSRGIAEVERRARQRGLGKPRWPDPWPNDGLRVMRAAVRAHELGAGKRFALSAFRTHFMEGRALTEPPAIASAAKYAGLDGGELLAATAEPDVKASLRANTERALGLGVFGVPTVVAGSEVFWGDDQLEAARATIVRR